MKIRYLLFTVCFSLFVPVAFGQTDRGTITGTVSDATAAVIPGVAIEAKNVQTGAVYQRWRGWNISRRQSRRAADI